MSPTLYRKERLISQIRQLAAEFLNRESNRLSLITITNIKLSDDYKHAIIEVSVLPDEQKIAALEFVNRKRGVLRSQLGSKMRLKRAPTVDFALSLSE